MRNIIQSASIERLKFYFQSFKRLEIFQKAGSLSFFTVIGIFPMLLLFITLLTNFFSQETVHNQINQILQENLPYYSQLIEENIRALQVKKSSMSWISVLSLFVSSQILFTQFERIVNTLLHTEKNRHYFKRKLIYLLWLFSMMLVLFLPFTLHPMQFLIQEFDITIPLLGPLVSITSFFIIGFIVFCLILLILPVERIHFARVMLGGVLYSLSLLIGRGLFLKITSLNLARYNLIYGSLASIILGLLWIFYVYNIFLFFVYWTGRKKDPFYSQYKNQKKSI